MVRAVMVTGDAEMESVGSGKRMTINAGAWRGEYLPEQALGLITSRYLLHARDCAVRTAGENFREMISSEARNSQIVNDNTGRVFIKIRPKRIRAWDFLQGTDWLVGLNSIQMADQEQSGDETSCL